MIEREDIDALLVGALYGELDAAEQARLDEHLVSHPADKTALDELKAVRGRVTSSRIFEVQAEPPQAISARLMQEAARRAPAKARTNEGWFARFVNSFVAHPAMAAAATLVLVVGVAGTIYLKNGQKPDAAESITAQQSSPAPMGAAAGSAAVGKDEVNIPTEQKREELRAKQESVAVALDEGEGQAKTRVATDPSATGKPHRAKGELAFADGAKKGGEAKAAPAKQDSYVEVPSADRRAPKDLAQDKADDVVAQAPGAEAAPMAPASSTGMVLGGAAAPAPAPPPPPPAATEKTMAPAKTVTKESSPTELAWAKDQHARITALVKDGKCQEAAPLARAIRNRTPSYFSSYVATDRELKACMPYIQDTSANPPKAAADRTEAR